MHTGTPPGGERRFWPATRNGGTIMNDKHLLVPGSRRSFLEHLVGRCNFLKHTQSSYREHPDPVCGVRRVQVGQPFNRMTVEDLTPSMVRQFLDHLERDRPASAPRARIALP